ncbi:MAG TPA: ROK family transcriptional regulator [Gaiellaceae bacterium]|jgi:predicted NBD/HSP70 family sugar kinase|nr:ROK family transcriptional regulator [Gaiellaceae bacterium]
MTFDRGIPLPADQTTVRRTNLGVVLRHVAAAGSRSRAQIAAGTGLTRGTVSSLVAELIDLELLRETGTCQPHGIGRPGVVLELADVLVGIGLEVNVDYVAVSVEDLTGAVRYEKRSYRENRGSAPGPVLDRLARTARAALDAAAREDLRPIGFSVAVPGLVEEASGTLVFAPNLGWENVPVAAELEARLGVPVHVENESNLAALAEHWTGAAVGIDDFVCVFGEVGVGGGVVLGGRLFRGTHGFGGEFGHVSVDAGGRQCACGSRGCVETVVGQESIAAAAGISISGRTRKLTDELVRRAEAGEGDVLRALDDAGRWLGIALASTFNVLDLQAVVLGGCFGPLSPWLVDEVRRTLEERSLAARSGSFAVLPSAFGDGAAVRGAAALSLHRVLDQPWTVQAANGNGGGTRRPGSAPRTGRPRKEVAIGLH